MSFEITSTCEDEVEQKYRPDHCDEPAEQNQSVRCMAVLKPHPGNHDDRCGVLDQKRDADRHVRDRVEAERRQRLSVPFGTEIAIKNKFGSHRGIRLRALVLATIGW